MFEVGFTSQDGKDRILRYLDVSQAIVHLNTAFNREPSMAEIVGTERGKTANSQIGEPSMEKPQTVN